MRKKFGKICATARDDAGYTQEQAAPELNVSTRSLSDYEQGKTIVPEDVVLTMMDIYNAQWLGYLYLQIANEVGRKILPGIEFRDVSTSLLMVQREMNHVSGTMSSMIEACSDGVITDDEQPEWMRCITEIKHQISAGLSLMFAPVQKEKSPVLAHRRLTS